MPEISKIKLPSGNTYDIKDAVARQAIAGGMTKIIAWNGASTPTVANIPAGVVVTYGGQNYTGTLSVADADQTGFYFVYSNTQTETLDVYDEYTIVEIGGTKKWEKIGDTRLDLSSLGDLAYKDTAAVTFTGGTTDTVLGSDATFTTTVTPETQYLYVQLNGTPSSATFVKSYPGATSKLATTTVPNVTGNSDVSIPNVTSVGAASTWSFALGSGDDAGTLIISGGNGTAPTLGTAISASKVTLGAAKTVATGSLSANGGGDTVMTGLGTATTGSAITSAPSYITEANSIAGVGAQVVTGISSATTITNNKDQVTAITNIGTGTAS